MRITAFLIIVFLFTGCAKYINVDSKNYQWKNFDESTNQSLDLSQYKSPNLRDGQNPNRLVILSATGGGSRAAAFTIGSLLELENILTNEKAESYNGNNILNEIDFFSTVSGGGWGASSYISYLYYKQKYSCNYITLYPTFNSYEVILSNSIDRSYAKHQLKYFLGGIFSNKLNYISGAVMMDRLNTGYLGWGQRAKVEESFWNLENHTEFEIDSVESIKLGDVFKLKNSEFKPTLPMFIANTTNITNYMLVPFSPDRLEWWGLKQYTYTTKNGPKFYPLEPLNVLNKEDLLNIPLAAAIKASSSVPGFIGSSTFLSQKDNTSFTLRLEDGGITDNFGLHTVKSILRQEDKILDKENRIVIIIDATASGTKSSFEKEKKINRLNSVIKVASAAPDAQYPITRERILALEKEYNCTVIYIGTETLIDPELGMKGSFKNEIKMKKEIAEIEFYSHYIKALKDNEFYNKVSMDERAILYEYVRTFVPTWFSANGTNNNGIYPENIEDVNGTGRIITLAGRAAVQLKRSEILEKFGIN